MGDRCHDIFPVWAIFCYNFNAFYKQRLNCIFSVHAIRMAHDCFIIVTQSHTLHLSAKKRNICFSDKILLLFTAIVTATIFVYGIVVLCSDHKFINVSHEKIDIKIEIAVF